MKDKQAKKEKKKEKMDNSITKAKSDYQNEKTRKSLPDTLSSKLKK